MLPQNILSWSRPRAFLTWMTSVVSQLLSLLSFCPLQSSPNTEMRVILTTCRFMMSSFCSQPLMGLISDQSKVLAMVYKVLPAFTPPHLWLHSLIRWPSHILLQPHYPPYCSANTSRHTVASGSLYLLLPLPWMLLPKTPTLLVPLHHLRRKTPPGHLIQNITPTQTFRSPSLSNQRYCSLICLLIFHL